MISKYITENGKFRQIDEFMPGTWINLTAPTQDESLEIARRYNVDLADIRAALDDEESSRVDVNDDYVLILFDIPSVEIRHNQEAYTTIPLGVVWTDDAIITVCSAETPVLKHFIVNNIRDFTTKKQVRFTYQIMYRTSMLYQSYLRIIDRRRLEMEERMGGATEDADIVNLHEMESNLVYFDTSLRAKGIVTEAPVVHIDVEVGDQIKVITGAWEGNVAVVKAINESKRTVTIDVDIFGRATSVEIGFGDIQKM